MKNLIIAGLIINTYAFPIFSDCCLFSMVGVFGGILCGVGACKASEMNVTRNGQVEIASDQVGEIPAVFTAQVDEPFTSDRNLRIAHAEFASDQVRGIPAVVTAQVVPPVRSDRNLPIVHAELVTTQVDRPVSFMWMK